jgi:hydrogenase nickel incorporation protein HypA/HybF
VHELGIVFHIVDTVEQVARDNDLTRVSCVTLELGEVSGVVDSYLQDAWRWAAARSKVLDGATLAVEPIPAVTLCESCGQTYGTVEHGRICPLCGSEATHLVTGNEMVIKQIEGE